MRGSHKLLAVTAVIAIGVGAALPFRREEPLREPIPELTATQSDPLVRRQHVPLSVSMETAASPAVGLDFDEPEPTRASASLSGVNAAQPTIDSASPPPTLPSNYRPVADPLASSPTSPAALPRTNPPAENPPPASLDANTGSRSSNLTESSLRRLPASDKSAAEITAPTTRLRMPQGNLALQAEPRQLSLRAIQPSRIEAGQPPTFRPTPGEEARWRRHRLVDGDTLSALATRYLGSAERSSEIYQANARRLPSPRVLPLGVEILIPPQDATP